jgi:hypothetical protein
MVLVACGTSVTLPLELLVPLPKTPEDRRRALASLARVRAVESPPDASSGLRTVWHRGPADAELTTWIDSRGIVSRHELSLFDDAAVWDSVTGLVTGTGSVGADGRGSALFSADLPESDTRTQRLARLAAAVEGYDGTDRILQHLKDQLVGVPLSATPVPVTRPFPKLPAPAKASVPRRRWHRGLVVTVAAVALLVLLWWWRA